MLIALQTVAHGTREKCDPASSSDVDDRQIATPDMSSALPAIGLIRVLGRLTRTCGMQSGNRIAHGAKTCC